MHIDVTTAFGKEEKSVGRIVKLMEKKCSL